MGVALCMLRDGITIKIFDFQYFLQIIFEKDILL
jgi:hypothetical protein